MRKNGQNTLFREDTGSAYFRSKSENKWVYNHGKKLMAKRQKVLSLVFWLYHLFVRFFRDQ